LIDSLKAWLAIRAFLKKHPVRAEQTGERNLEFSQWLRTNCRPSKAGCTVDYVELGCFVAFDLDFILFDYKRNLVQLLEVKTRNGRLRWSQRQTLLMLDKIMTAGAPLIGVEYLGLHVLTMDGLEPWTSSRIAWDGQHVTQKECWRRVNMFSSLEAETLCQRPLHSNHGDSTLE